jgi:hypothetical protein
VSSVPEREGRVKDEKLRIILPHSILPTPYSLAKRDVTRRVILQKTWFASNCRQKVQLFGFLSKSKGEIP